MNTLKEIADKLNISVSTVSLAINKPHKISTEVRQKIYDVINEHGYKKTDKVNVENIGIVMSSISKYFGNEYYNEVLEGAFSAISQHKLNLKVFQDLKVDYSNIYGLQGMILLGKTDNDTYSKIQHYKLPAVSCGHPHPDYTNVTSIYHERTASTKLILDFLLSCGHENIAVIIGDDPKDSIQKEFLDTIEQNNPHFKPELVFQADYENIQTVEILFNRITTLTPKITAIMCVNDLIAYYIYNYAEKYRIKIPDQISVTGFDGITIPRYLKKPEPALTTIISDRRQLGSQAVELLIQRVKNTGSTGTKVLIPGYLSIGSSVGRI